MKIYTSAFLGVATNATYPHEREINTTEDLRAAVSKDYVCAAYRNHYRSNDNFLGSDCLPADCDNDHSDDPRQWVTPDDFADAFPGVRFFVHYSRNHMREKGGKAARPKFHVFFPIPFVSDQRRYADLKRRLLAAFPYFDRNALDAARFFFGTESPVVEERGGAMDVTEFLEEEGFDSAFSMPAIRAGSRNSTMSRYAGRLLKKYGEGGEARKAFDELSGKCDPPLERSELDSIWASALKFYRRVAKEPGYVRPEQYNDANSYKPGDYSDVGQAEVLSRSFQGELRYSPQTGFIKYRGSRWQETEPGAQAVAQELTRRQMREAKALTFKALEEVRRAGAEELIGKKGASMTPEQQKAVQRYLDARAYAEFALKRRDSRFLQSALKEARPMIEISVSDLDQEPYLLNTPEATYDLRYGEKGAREHSPDDLITKITAVSPGRKGREQWEAALKTFFGDDAELIDYVQKICGLAAIGKVYVEALIIAYGDGGNGKSTFWNAIARVMGEYSGNISADTLTRNVMRNTKPELAEARGKRLLIAAESQEGAVLNDSMVKQLCSTDEIFAEKKYRDPFSFKPTHTLVLYTNHLPKVGTSDDGIWRRLIVIPFSRKIPKSGDRKNYGDELVNSAGQYILTWIIEGARKAIEADFRIEFPEVVKDAIAEYREQNDWFRHFLQDRCEEGPKLEESASKLYATYRTYCEQTGEYIRRQDDFAAAMQKAGFRKGMRKRLRVYIGLKVKPGEGDFDDFFEKRRALIRTELHTIFGLTEAITPAVTSASPSTVEPTKSVSSTEGEE